MKEKRREGGKWPISKVLGDDRKEKGRRRMACLIHASPRIFFLVKLRRRGKKTILFFCCPSNGSPRIWQKMCRSP